MHFDKNPLPAPAGMTFEQMLSLPVADGGWRESDRYICAHCIQPKSTRLTTPAEPSRLRRNIKIAIQRQGPGCSSMSA